MSRWNIDLPEGEWVARLVATRHGADFGFGGNHGYLQMAIPGSDGNYRIYPFGKYPTQYPLHLWELTGVVFRPSKAYVTYPDENTYYLHRSEAGHAFTITLQEGNGLMQSIQKDILNARKGNFAFQLISENCLRWAWKKVHHHLGEDRVPNYFPGTIFEIPMAGPFGKLLNKMASWPAWIRAIIGTFVAVPFGAHMSHTVVRKNGKLRRVSFMSRPPWDKEHNFIHPGCLFTNN